MASLPNVGSLQRLLLRGTMERTRSLVSYSWIRRIERVPHEAIWPALRAHDVGGGGGRRAGQFCKTVVYEREKFCSHTSRPSPVVSMTSLRRGSAIPLFPFILSG